MANSLNPQPESSTEIDFADHWGHLSIEGKISEGIELRSQKEKQFKHENDHSNVNLYSNKRFQRNNQRNIPLRRAGYKEPYIICTSSLDRPSAVKKSFKNKPGNILNTCSQRRRKSSPECPLRIVELAVPSKRHCIETWRSNHDTLPGFMIDRLKQHVLDQKPIVEIPEAIQYFSSHRHSNKKAKKMTLTERIKQEKNTETRNLCAIFGHKIARKLFIPYEIFLKPDLQKLAAVIDKNVTELIKSKKNIDVDNGSYKKIQTEISNRIVSWISDIIDESFSKQLEDDFRVQKNKERKLGKEELLMTLVETVTQQGSDLEEEEGHIWNILDNVVDNALDVCRVYSSSSSDFCDSMMNVADDSSEAYNLTNREDEFKDKSDNDESSTESNSDIIKDGGNEENESGTDVNKTEQDVEMLTSDLDDQSSTSLLQENNDKVNDEETKSPEEIINEIQDSQESDVFKTDKVENNFEDALDFLDPTQVNKNDITEATAFDIENEFVKSENIPQNDPDNMTDVNSLNQNTNYTEISNNNNSNELEQSEIVPENKPDDVIHENNTDNLKEYNTITNNTGELEIDNEKNNLTSSAINILDVDKKGDQLEREQENEFNENLDTLTPQDTQQEISETKREQNNTGIEFVDDIAGNQHLKSLDIENGIQGISEVAKTSALLGNENLETEDQDKVRTNNEDDFEDPNKKVKFSGGHLDFLGKSATKSSINFSEPNLHLLSDADESWPKDIDKSHKLTLSVSKSVTSLGNILELDEKIYTDTPSNLKQINLLQKAMKSNSKSQSLARILNELVNLNKSNENVIPKKVKSNDDLTQEKKINLIDYENTNAEDRNKLQDGLYSHKNKPNELSNGIDNVTIMTKPVNNKINKGPDNKHNKNINKKNQDTQNTKSDVKQSLQPKRKAPKSITSKSKLNKISKIEKNTGRGDQSLFLDKDNKDLETMVKSQLSYILLKNKAYIDSKVNFSTAPSWVFRANNKSMNNISYKTKDLLPNQNSVRKWCKDLERVTSNMDKWNKWISDTCENIAYVKRQQKLAYHLNVCDAKNTYKSKMLDTINLNSKRHRDHKWLKLNEVIEEDASAWLSAKNKMATKLKYYRQLMRPKSEITSTERYIKCKCSGKKIPQIKNNK